MAPGASSSRRAASSYNSNSGPIMLDLSSGDEMEERKGRPSRYTRWPYKDEALILRALAAGRRRYGQLPQLSVLCNALRPRFVRKDVTDADVSKKISNLQHKYWRIITFHLPLKSSRDEELQRLSTNVWGDDDDEDFDL